MSYIVRQTLNDFGIETKYPSYISIPRYPTSLSSRVSNSDRILHLIRTTYFPVSRRYTRRDHTAFPLLAFYQNLPAHHLTVVAANCQPQSGATVSSRC